MSRSFLIGQKASFLRKGLRPKTPYNIKLELTDTLGKKFHNSREFETNIDGVLEIAENEFQSTIASASSGKILSSYPFLPSFVFVNVKSLNSN